MATNQMEDSFLIKTRDEAIAAIIEQFPNTDIFVKGDNLTLYVCATDRPCSAFIFDAKMFDREWKDLMWYVDEREHYSKPLCEHGYYWVDRVHRRNWTLCRRF